MYNVKTYITIQQIPTKDYPDRKRLLAFPYTVDFEGQSSWMNLTSTFKLTAPKKMSLLDVGNKEYIRLYNTDGKNSNIGGYVGEKSPTGSAPAILRGDVVTIQAGYETILNGKDSQRVTYMTGKADPTKVYDTIPTLFKGFVSSVDPASPFTIYCEDNMWLLKQVPTPITQSRWTGKTIQKIVQEILDDAKTLPNLSKYNLNLTVSKFSLTDLVFNVGNFITRGESLAEVLTRVKQQYQLDSYFRGDELRIGLNHYLPADTKKQKFTFQRNIISDSLKYQRKDDVNMSMVVQSHYEEETGTTTTDGQKVTKKRNTEILIYRDPKTFELTYKVKEQGQPYFKKNDIDVSGLRFNMQIYAAVTDPKKLFEMGSAKLQQYYYNGFTGSFTTFGIPYVKHGDDVELVDNLIPERNGTYKVKAVTYSFSCAGGLRQTIELDYREI